MKKLVACTTQSLRIVAFCALAAALTIIVPRTTNPCAYSMSRSILSVTGLDPFLITCSSDASLSDGAGDKMKAGSGGPIVTDLHLCGDPDPPDYPPPAPFKCCPPMISSSEPVNFTFPDPAEPLRTRRPAHEAGSDHMAKYRRAVALMKALPRTDPRSFYQQANVHCAYCSGALRQLGRPELPVQIHFTWLFFPFHRSYLYFFERIAAKLLGDPGFALPFWSWDVPEGMRIPDEFADRASPLYNARRNPRHLPPKVLDLEFMEVENNYTDEQQIQRNLWVMHKQMVTNAPLPSLFYGQPYRTGDSAMPGAGTVEVCPHNTMHVWTGDLRYPNIEDMGIYYSSGRDPIFYTHHANIDRLWDSWRHIMRTTRGNQTQVDLTDPDWLDASFLFYDEDARLVRVTVRDMLDADKLRYTYGGVGMPWLNARPPTSPGVNGKRSRLKSVSFPVFLDEAVTVEVSRPAPPRNRQEEVLVVEGIEVDSADFVKFEVYVNAIEYHKVQPGGRELAGTFVTLKQPGEEAETMRTTMRVALNQLLEDLGVEGDDSVTVTLVPVRGKVRIGGLRIVYVAE
ncbi:hypothetical protein PR202_gb04599 [Eleusine coracana subsp. coracana]|uniref:Tyrosinase copper-binding domain-containing protein n=1 Tax=Eleusine coracana subsp. coracana TaxID=191504 RepID=A0AAV5E484_ELECO|nr:hypothetical protein QOZ80_1BG0084900 [Eleusine coracana subsp. coracana]GJN17523.1 hypothetical protein PR202_gb04599 [Eleusine coracana subsp. coracana]